MILGYVVNIQDSVNYDINLLISPELRKKYSQSIYNKYTYEDQNGNERIAIAYRCRLKGVNLLNVTPDNSHGNFMGKNNEREEKNNQGRNIRPLKKIRKTSNQVIRNAHVELIQKIDRSNGWVLCEIFEIDIYQRILVRIYDPITKEDLTEFLFNPPYNSHFFSYHSFINS